jgi:hypothetical protein
MNLFNNIFTDYKSQLIVTQEENKRITNDLDDYKIRLQICQDENKRIANELVEYKLRLQVSEVKNKQLVNDWEVFQHERDEMREMKENFKLRNKEYEDREELVNHLKLLHGENKKLRDEVIEMRRVIINRKRL